MTMVHKVTGKNAFVIETNKAQLVQEQLVLRLQELGISLKSAKILVEYSLLSYADITAIMSGAQVVCSTGIKIDVPSVLLPKDKIIRVVYDVLCRTKSIRKNNDVQDMQEYIRRYSESMIFEVINKEEVLLQAEKNKQVKLHGIFLSPREALILAVHDYLMRRQGKMELEQRFNSQGMAQGIDCPQAQEVPCDMLYIFILYERALKEYEQAHIARNNDALPTIVRNYLHHLDHTTANEVGIVQTIENNNQSRKEQTERNISRDIANGPEYVNKLREKFPDLPPLPMKK